MIRPKKVVIIGADWPELEQYCPNWHGMRVGMARLGIPYIFVSCRPKLNVEQITAFKPDLVIYALKDMVQRSDWRKEIRQKLPEATIVIWYGDMRDDLTTQIDADCSEIQAMFVSNDAQESYYKRKWLVPAVHYLPLGCEPIESPKISKLYNFPFVFIGGQFQEGSFQRRAGLIERFKKEADLTLINSFEPPLRSRIFREMPAIYGSSKICLDISHFTSIQGYTSIRFFEIPAFWGFALTKRFPGCEELYPESTRAYFNTFEEALEKKAFYLQHEAARQKMVHEAHKIAQNHTYDKRFSRMFSLL